MNWEEALRAILIAQGTDPSCCDTRPRKKKPSALEALPFQEETDEDMGAFL